MDPTELTKHLPEIAKATTAVAASIPFTAIVKKMLGPAADELAEMWRDQVRLYRYERQLKCVEKAERMAKDAGFTPQAVPPKILFPLLEGASFEEDENLHDMWAALLANAASGKPQMIRPTFIPLLREMAPDEADLLKLISEELEALHYPNKTNAWRRSISDDSGELFGKFHVVVGESENTTKARYEACIQALITAGLIFQSYQIRYGLTGRGVTFLDACRPPKPKS